MSKRTKNIARFIPLAMLAVFATLIYVSGLHQYLSFSSLKANRLVITSFVEGHAFTSAIIFVFIYAAIVALSIPGAAFMTITGGFLFGQVRGTLYVVIAATLGATLLFLIARHAVGGLLEKRAGPWFKKMEKGFQENAFSYLLFLRLVPAFPFFIVNLVPAFLGVSLRTFVIATLIGIVPGSFVYVSIGTGLGSIFDRGEEFSAKGILTPEIILALSGLAILALIPVFYKRKR